jgi:hypothetical protein
LGIFFCSYESRTLASTGEILNSKSCNHSIIVSFDESSNTVSRTKYDPILKDQIATCSVNTPLMVYGSIKDIVSLIENILSAVPEECWGQYSKWFLDISGAPTPYYLGLLGYLRDFFPCPKITVFNPTGIYDNLTESYTFTEGFDRVIWIPRLWGRPEPLFPKKYVFLLGFDGSRSYELFYKCEPDSVVAIVADPGYIDGYEKESLKRNKLFLQESGLWTRESDPTVIRVDASNPISMITRLREILSEDPQYNYVFVPLGTKAHALGCGLCALIDGKPAVLYHMPRAYALNDVGRGKYLWKYEISM